MFRPSPGTSPGAGYARRLQAIAVASRPLADLIDRIALFIAERQYQHDLKRLEEIVMTYKLMKRIIQKGGYDRENTLQKLDVFLMADRITPEEYQELVELMGGGENG